MKNFRTNIAGVSPWEDIVGYSRIVIIGDQVEVAGTTAVKDGKPYAVGEFFKDIKPAATMVEVASLIDKDLLVEIEVFAKLAME